MSSNLAEEMLSTQRFSSKETGFICFLLSLILVCKLLLAMYLKTMLCTEIGVVDIKSWF